jgi:Na+/H+-dicarboxylate symporter
LAISIPKGVKPLVDFSTQILFGAIAFVVVLLIACLLSLFMKWIAAIGPQWLIVAGEWVEKIVFGLDLACFGVFLVIEVVKFLRASWDELREVLKKNDRATGTHAP